MTAPTVNVVRALDDNISPSIEALDLQITETVQALHKMYVQRTALQALRDMRGLFNGGIV